MSTSPEHPDDSRPPVAPPPPPGGEAPFITIIVAILFLYFGFWGSFVPFEDDPVAQRISIHVFNWMARIVGIGLLVAAGMAYLRVPVATLVNLVLTAIAAIVCLVAGAIWLANGYTTGLLIVLFGLLNGNSARALWQDWQSQRAFAPSPPDSYD